MPRKNTAKAKIKVYPSNIDAEKSILASILLDKKISINIIPKLKEEDFNEPKHKEIFAACRDLFIASIPVDMVVLTDKLRKKGSLESAGGAAYLVELTQFIPSAAGYSYHLNILKRDALLRSLIDLSIEISEDAYTSDDAENSLSFAQSLILNVSKQQESGRELTHIGDIVYDVIEGIEQRFADPDAAKGLMTGFWNLDEHTGGLQKSDVILIAARPGVGKTAFALNIAANIAKRRENKKILIFSLEMSDTQLVQRMLCNMGSLDNSNIRQGNLEPTDFVTLREAGAMLAESGIYLDQTSVVTPSDIVAKCKTFKLEHKQLDLVIVDYLQLMKMAKRPESRQQEVSDISREMKLLAKELNIPLILVSQMSRGAEMSNTKPQLHHLRDSGAIEQDADIVAFLYKLKNEKSNDEYIEFIIAKYRNGQTRSLIFRWEGKTFTFFPEGYDKLKELQSTSGTDKNSHKKEDKE